MRFEFLILISLLAAVSCESEDSDFRRARNTGTVDAYREFLNQHPNSVMASYVRNQIDSLTATPEDLDFRQMSSVGTVSAYREFLKQYPNSHMVSYVQGTIDSLTEISGGCKAGNGSLSDSQTKSLRQISSLAKSHSDLKMFKELYELLKQDSTLIENARSLIQGMILSVIDSEVIDDRTSWRIWDELDEKDSYRFIHKLADIYASDSVMCPKYSYEAMLCFELEIFADFCTIREDLEKNLKALDSSENLNEMMDAGREVRYLYTTRIPVYLRTTEDRLGKVAKNCPLDVCARMRYWELVTRMFTAEKYADFQVFQTYSFKGLEHSDVLNPALKELYGDERNEVVRKAANKVISRINEARTQPN